MTKNTASGAYPSVEHLKGQHLIGMCMPCWINLGFFSKICDFFLAVPVAIFLVIVVWLLLQQASLASHISTSVLLQWLL